jgi:AcrR family transcriptional regulator
VSGLEVSSAPAGARERILATAYELFSRRGVRAVGIDEVISRSGVAKATMYKYFPTKADLALAFLQRREQRWTVEFVEQRSAARAGDPEGQLLAIFDVFDEWFRQPDAFDACSFINVLVEMGPAHALGQAAIVHLANIRAIVARRAAAAGLIDPERFAACWHILMKGAIISATEGDTTAAQHAKAMARSLIEQHRDQGARLLP